MGRFYDIRRLGLARQGGSRRGSGSGGVWQHAGGQEGRSVLTAERGADRKSATSVRLIQTPGDFATFRASRDPREDELSQPPRRIQRRRALSDFEVEAEAP